MQTDPNQKTLIVFVTEKFKRLQGVMSSYDKSLAKIDEMESYDEQLKHRYLKMTLKQVNDLKTQLTSDIKKFQVKQKEEREKFAAMMKTLETKIQSERERQEELEVQMYEQSVKMATLSEDTEKVLTFMEEFIKRQIGGGSQKPRDNTMFRELSENDKESVNELLKSLGVQYKEVF